MMKCDMCYDRTSEGLKPMCATVCPSQALFFGTREQIKIMRPRSVPTNEFRFGDQTITTKVNMMLPKTGKAEYIDVTRAMDGSGFGKTMSLNIIDAMYDGGPDN
jgi:Fe-S-cluster-containing dehydrogenase component